MKKGAFLILIVLLLVIIPIIDAQPPFGQPTIFTNGYEIKIPPFSTLEQNQDFEFSFHVYNISNGVPVDNSSTNCNFHLYDNKGDHLVAANDFPHTEDHGVSNEWEITILGGNFSRLGSYSYLISCNSTTLGGFESISFRVTPNGLFMEEGDSIVHFSLLVGVLFFFVLTLYGGIVLPFRNKRGERNEVIAIEKLKYFKIGFLFLSYVLFVWSANLLFALSRNFTLLTQYTAFFEVIFVVMNAMSYPVFVFMLVFMAALAWKDLKLKELLLRGINPR